MGDRADARLIEQAARQLWPLDAAAQARVTARLVALIEQDGQKPRTITAAARALAALGQLALRQQDLDARAEPPVGDGIDLREAVESEWYAGYTAACEVSPAEREEQRRRRLADLVEAERLERDRLRALAGPGGPPSAAPRPG
jgi:hypothetical protein